MRKLWHGIKKKNTACPCLKNVSSVRTVASLPTNNMSCGYEEQSTVPVARSEIDELRSMVVNKLQEQNKYFFEQMKRQQVCYCNNRWLTLNHLTTAENYKLYFSTGGDQRS